jgi:enoyl-CoA hydratase
MAARWPGGGNMVYTTILYEKSDGIGTITLNRPKSMNALNSILLGELNYAFNEIARDTEVRVVIITGSDKFFAAGADINEIANLATPAEVHDWLTADNIFLRLEDFDKPVIALVRGLALGGGCELAMACDMRIAAENAVFGQPEIKIGIIPGGGGTQRLPRLIGVTKAKELLFTGDNIDANEAYRLGLINKVVTVDAAMDEARKVALKIVRQPAMALRATKMAINGGMNMDIKSAMAYEARCFENLFSTEDQKEGTKAFLEKRKPIFKNR